MQKNKKNVDSKVLEIKIGRTVLLSKCSACSSKTLRFMKEQEAKGILSSLRLKTPLSKIPVLGDNLF